MKEKMNPKTKRAVVVLSTITLFILIAGLASCSIQLSQKDSVPFAVMDSNAPDPAQTHLFPRQDYHGVKERT